MEESEAFNLVALCKENEYYRKVHNTGKYIQIVFMSLTPNEEIGEEIHEQTDQFFNIIEGSALFSLNGKISKVNEGSAIIVHSGTPHNIINNSNNTNLKLVTIYSPPHHPSNTIHKTKQEYNHQYNNIKCEYCGKDNAMFTKCGDNSKEKYYCNQYCLNKSYL